MLLEQLKGCGAGGETRTLTLFPEPDFENNASVKKHL